MFTRKTLLASSLAMILTACGGPNNPSGPAPVDNTPLPPISDFISFSIVGQVIGSVSSTNLTLYYGGTAVGVSVDVNGHYIADVSLLSTEDNYVVYAVATDSQNDEINLVSIVGSVVELDAAAGADDMLTFDEALGVNVSGLSTALTALMEAANDGAVIIDKPMFDKAQKNYDSVLLRPYANAIGLVTDNAGAVDYLNLPEGFADTWALVNAAQAVKNYINTVRQNASQL
ncbi:MAG: hypothetical protein MJK04_29115, partial [Psychrosphaera sp.]|nr:hypothetical protein [Psychrosphaera sp.]